MKLNHTSYGHRAVRTLCTEFEKMTRLKLITNLDEEFDQIRFVNALSYIVIDFKHGACFTMSYSMDVKEWNIVEDILSHTMFFYIGENWRRIAQNRARRAKRAKNKKSSKKN